MFSGTTVRRRDALLLAGSSILRLQSPLGGQTPAFINSLAVMLADRLQPLPLEPFCSYRFGERVPHLDGCVEVEAACYSVHTEGSSGASRNPAWTE
jgi:hypothetical protein